MNFNNKYIVLFIIIIIIIIFIYNYDIYVLSKNEPLCKPIYITKREIPADIRAKLNKSESNIFKEGFNNLIKSGFYEEFNNLSEHYDVPPKTLSEFTMKHITNPNKIKVIDSVIKVLVYIPTNYSEQQIKQLLEYFGLIYQSSSSLENFYKNVSTSTKIKEEPYNSKYSHLILFLIGKFDNDYSNCINSDVDNQNCAINELITQNNQTNKLSENILPNSKLSENILPNSKLSENILSNSKLSENILPNSKLSEYLNNNKKIFEEPKKYNIPHINSELSTYKKESKSFNQLNSINELNNKSNYLNPDSSIHSINELNNKSNYLNPDHNSKCGGTTCSYKCNSSYMDAINYLNDELKPLESFDNLQFSNYAKYN